MAYNKRGQGPAIVLVHGVGLCADAWLHQIEALAKTHTVYAVDMPGHGESDLLSIAKPELTDYVDAIAHWIEHEIKTPVIMMGHSMGAMITLDFAIRYSNKCSAAVALNAIYGRTDDARNAVQQRAQKMLLNPELNDVDTPIKRWFGESPEGFMAEMAELCRQWLTSAPNLGYATAYDIFSRSDGSSAKALSKLQTPIAFITGAMDNNSTDEMSEQMAELAPLGTAHVIQDARHMVQLTHYQDVNRILVNFVNTLPVAT